MHLVGSCTKQAFLVHHVTLPLTQPQVLQPSYHILHLAGHLRTGGTEIFNQKN